MRAPEPSPARGGGPNNTQASGRHLPQLNLLLYGGHKADQGPQTHKLLVVGSPTLPAVTRRGKGDHFMGPACGTKLFGAALGGGRVLFGAVFDGGTRLFGAVLSGNMTRCL